MKIKEDTEMAQIKVIERTTGTEFQAEKIEGGYQVFTLAGEKYKKLKDSTFKKYFKVTGETTKAEEPKHEELSPEKREKMVEKIKKMLALAENNPSEEEAFSAMLQAHKLIVKYNIHEDDVTLEEVKDEITSIFSQQPHDSHLMGWRKQLGVVVSKAFRCKVYMHGKDVVFRGYKEDAQLALDVYLMLYTVGHKLAKKAESKARTLTGTAKGIYTTYASGFLKGVNDALNQQCTALMVVTPKEVEEEYEVFSAEFKKSRSTRLVNYDDSVFQEGYREGKAVANARSIEGKED